MTERQLLPEMEEIWLNTLGWQPDREQKPKFQRLYEKILAANRSINLTRITQPIEFWEKHLWDSLAGMVGLGISTQLEKKESLKAIDIGTGAGFPGIPVAIVFPFWTVTLLDATRKKTNFLETLVDRLDLNNIKILTGRAEEIGRDRYHREAYDLALIRAVSQPSVCAEYALPLLKIGALAILYRGAWSDDETIALQGAVKKLGGKIEKIEALSTPVSNSARHCLYLRKIAPTHPEFPRLTGIPAQKPL
jgi:16S rRNA (guanine527-N7)-methyltransferase